MPTAKVQNCCNNIKDGLRNVFVVYKNYVHFHFLFSFFFSSLLLYVFFYGHFIDRTSCAWLTGCHIHIATMMRLFASYLLNMSLLICHTHFHLLSALHSLTKIKKRKKINKQAKMKKCEKIQCNALCNVAYA